MAIAFARAEYRKLGNGGAVRDLCYLGRQPLQDHQLQRPMSLVHDRTDLVYHVLYLPDDAPASLQDLEEFANAVNAAETDHIRTPLEQRKRLPQVALTIVIALPPDAELSLDESIILTTRLAAVAQGGRRTGHFIAIHDPDRLHPGANNRHAHIYQTRREIGPGGFSNSKVRDQTAKVRVKGGFRYVAEGIHWPDVARDIQQSLFTEFGLDLVVTPAAPFPQKHYGIASYRSRSNLVTFHREILRDLNTEAIRGEPTELIEKLLRGRSSLEIAELHQFVNRFIDSEADRSAMVDRILSDSEIVTLADGAGRTKPRFVTTANVNRAIAYAVDLLNRGRSIHVALGDGHNAIVAAIENVLADIAPEVPANRIRIVGQRTSDCDGVAPAIPRSDCTVVSVKLALSSVPTDGIVIVPHSESVSDHSLARLLATAEHADATVILGNDLSTDGGIVANRLAAHAVDRLASVQPQIKSALSAAPAEKLLRSGLISAAVKSMRGRIRFDQDRSEDRDSFDAIVCTDRLLLALVNEYMIERYRQSHGGLTETVLDTETGPRSFFPGQPIVFTRTDYSKTPPKFREGQLAHIVELDHDRSVAHCVLAGGTTMSLNTQQFPWVRSGFSLLVREAWHLPERSRIRIEVTGAKCAWAALLLAATRPNASVTIDSSIAGDIDQLIMAIRQSLPGALPTDASPRADPDAEASGLFDQLAATLEIEEIPMPLQSPSQTTSLAPVVVAAKVRKLLASNRDVAEGFAWLCRELDPANPNRDSFAERLLAQRDPRSLTAFIVNALLRNERERETKDASWDDFDLPRELELMQPKEWSEQDLYKLRIDLSTIALKSTDWNSPKSRLLTSKGQRSKGPS